MTEEKQNLLNYLQGHSHSIDVLLTSFYITDKNKSSIVGWMEIKEYLKNQGIYISDTAYKRRRNELVQLDLAELKPIDSYRNRIALTKKGVAVALLIIEFSEKLKDVEGLH